MFSFLYVAVSSCNAIVQNRPTRITTASYYTLRTRIKDTAKIGRDAGMYVYITKKMQY